MSVQLDKLDRESAMILYLAGELEPAEREAFERRLAAEPELAAELKQLRAAQQSVAAELARADNGSRLPVSEGVAVRRVSRAISSWIVGRNAAPLQIARKTAPLPWWSYPSAIAASLIVGFLVWSSRQEVKPMEPLPEAARELSLMEAEQSELAEWLTTSLDATADASMDAEVEQVLSVGGSADELNALYRSPQREENAQ
jgi:anti-sigma factor RsiW